jgi:hypothetical protein
MQFVGNGLTNGLLVSGFCTTTMRHAHFHKDNLSCWAKYKQIYVNNGMKLSEQPDVVINDIFDLTHNSKYLQSLMTSKHIAALILLARKVV